MSIDRDDHTPEGLSGRAGTPETHGYSLLSKEWGPHQGAVCVGSLKDLKILQEFADSHGFHWNEIQVLQVEKVRSFIRNVISSGREVVTVSGFRQAYSGVRLLHVSWSKSDRFSVVALSGQSWRVRSTWPIKPRLI